MRTLMRTLTGLLALLVMGATTAAAGVGGSLDASGAGSVATGPVSATAGGSASASLNADLPPPPDVGPLVTEVEARASATQEIAMEGAAEASSTVESHVESSQASANAAAEAGANVASETGETAGEAQAAAEANASAQVENGASFLGWLRARITALVAGIQARVESTLEEEHELPDANADVGAKLDGLVKVGESSVAGGLAAKGTATANDVQGSAEGVLAGDLRVPGLSGL